MGNHDATFSGNAKTFLRLFVGQVSQSIDGNTSVVEWWIGYGHQVAGTGASWQNYHTCSFSAVVNGTTVYSTANADIDTRGLTVGATKGIASGQITVGHNADGTKTISVSASASDPGGIFGSASVSGTLALSTIPRATTPTLSKTSQALDGSDSVTINLPRASSSFTHDWSVSLAGTVVASGTGAATSAAFTIPAARQSLLPNSTSGSATVTVTTKSGSTVIGTKTLALTVTVPASVVPTVTLALARVDNSVPTAWAVYVQGKSGVKLTASSVGGAGGSTVTNLALSVAGRSSSVASPGASTAWTSGPLMSSGTLTAQATVTDSRGRTKTVTATLTVVAYTPPQITVAAAQRCGSGGAIDEATGTYIKVTATDSFSSVSSKNTITREVKFLAGTTAPTDSTGTVDTSTGTATTGGTYSSGSSIVKNGMNTSGAFAVTNVYTVRLKATDALGGVATAVLSVSTAFAALALMHGSTTVANAGVALGKIPTRAGLDVALPNSYFVNQALTGTQSVGGASTFNGGAQFNSRMVSEYGLVNYRGGATVHDPAFRRGVSGFTASAAAWSLTGVTLDAPLYMGGENGGLRATSPDAATTLTVYPNPSYAGGTVQVGDVLSMMVAVRLPSAVTDTAAYVQAVLYGSGGTTTSQVGDKMMMNEMAANTWYTLTCTRAALANTRLYSPRVQFVSVPAGTVVEIAYLDMQRLNIGLVAQKSIHGTTETWQSLTTTLTDLTNYTVSAVCQPGAWYKVTCAVSSKGTDTGSIASYQVFAGSTLIESFDQRADSSTGGSLQAATIVAMWRCPNTTSGAVTFKIRARLWTTAVQVITTADQASRGWKGMIVERVA